MLNRPAVLFADDLIWATTYLRAAVAARPESCCESVTVTTQKPDGSAADPAPSSGRVVTVRSDGGPRGATITKTTSLGVNVWAKTWPEATSLALIVAALLEASPGTGPVLAHTGVSGPIPVQAIPDDGQPHIYLSADLLVSGSAL